MVNNMKEILYFDNTPTVDYCCGKSYYEFIDYAFNESDYFMLVYINYNQNGYTKFMKETKELLQPFKIKTRKNPSWPGTLKTYAPNSDYEIVFYRNDKKAKKILKRVSCVSEWSRPFNPEDLAFFKKNACWFYSVGHERIAAIIEPTDKDKKFLETNNIPTYKMELTLSDVDYYKKFNEQLE